MSTTYVYELYLALLSQQISYDKEDGFRENFTSSNKCPQIKVQSTKHYYRG